MKKLLTFSFLFFLAFFSCEIEEEKESIPRFLFTEADRKLIPYKLGDSIIFENSQGKKRRYWVASVKEEEREHHCCLVGMGRAPEYIYSSIEIEILGSHVPNSRSVWRMSKQRTSLVISSNWHSFMGSTVLIKTTTTNPYMGTVIGKDVGNITVRGKLFSNVLYFASNGELVQPTEDIREMYYAYNAGFIKMKSKTGEIWDKIN